MEITALFETIFKRRSVRKYAQEPLSGKVLADIKSRLDGLKQLNGQTARFEIVPVSAVKNDKAPHYILAYCEEKTEAYINVGYCLQEMDLYIQSIGLGSLWLGMAKPEDNRDDERGKDFCIMLAFGKAGAPYRRGAGDFQRLEANNISNADNDIVQAARLAPSAMNSQPWKLTVEKEKIVIDYCGRGLLKGYLKKKLSKIDIGIITKHTEIALIKSGKTIISILPKLNNKSFGVCVSYKDTL